MRLSGVVRSQCLGIGARQQRPKEEPLHEIGTGSKGNITLRLRIDTFKYHLHLSRVRKGNNGTDKPVATRARIEGVEEAPVKLDHIGRKSPQV